jgi:uncharacterized protein
MKLEHRFTVPASAEQAWAVFNDLEQVVPCFPGAALTSLDDDGFAGTCKVKLGPISLQYNGTGRFVERDEAARRVVVEGKGKDKRGNGTATVLVTARMTGTGDAATAVEVDTDLTITGKPAQFGRGLMQEVSDKLLEQFVSCITTKLSPEASPAQPTDVLSGGSAPAAESTEDGAGAEPATGSPAAGSAAGGSAPAASAARTSEPGAPASTGSAAAGSAPRAEGRSSGQQGGSDADAADVPLDLGSVLLPTLAKRIAPYLIGAAIALFLRRLFRS